MALLKTNAEHVEHVSKAVEIIIPHVCSTVKQLNCMQVVKSQSKHVGAILSLVLPCRHAAYNIRTRAFNHS